MSNEIELVNSKLIEIYDEDETKRETVYNDLEEVKTNLKNIIDNGQKVLDRLGEIAVSSDDVDAYDTYAKLMKSMLDANKELGNNTKQRADTIKSDDEPIKNNSVTNNNLIVTESSTQDIIEKLSKKD